MPKQFLLISWFLICTLYTNNLLAKPVVDWTDFIDTWCEKHFDKCFKGRNYKKIEVLDTEVFADHTLLTGKVIYKGYFGITFVTDFEAKLFISDNAIKVEFNKEGKTAKGESYWEDCTKSISTK